VSGGDARSGARVAAPSGEDPKDPVALLDAVLVTPRLWVLGMAILGLASCFSIDHPASGGVRVEFGVSTTSIGLFALIWLPAALRLLALTGGKFKAAGIEASSDGLLGNSEDLIERLAGVRSAAEEIELRSPGRPNMGMVTQRIDDIAERFVATDAISSEIVTRLANEYEEIRRRMNSGDDRTVQMTRVVNEARVRASADRPRARDYSLFLVRSDGGGRRIVGLAFLQEVPDPGALEDVLRLVADSDTAFEMYHALVAIGGMAHLLTSSQKSIAIDVLVAEMGDPRGVGVMQDANLPDLIPDVIGLLGGSSARR
jgi:hypothetical protein